MTGATGADTVTVLLTTGVDGTPAITVSILNLYVPYTDPGIITDDNIFLFIPVWIDVQLPLSICLYKLYV